jgi:FkbM family methyltransferase
MICEYTVQGASFKFSDPDESIPNETFQGTTYEPSVFTLLKHIVSDKSVFLDVGAHYGYFSLFCKSVASGCSVHAFEPSPVHGITLKENIELNGYEINVHNVALSNEHSSATFWDRTLTVPDDRRNEAIEVPTLTFDEFEKENSLKPSIVKVDVHGAELLVLEGMRQTLQSSVNHIFIELHAKHLMPQTASYEEILQLLLDAELNVFEMLEFRSSDTPNLRMVNTSNWDSIVDYSRWSKEDISTERMLFATRFAG